MYRSSDMVNICRIKILLVLGFSLQTKVIASDTDQVTEFTAPKKENILRLPDNQTKKVGRYTNVRIGGDGLPIIAFNDEFQGGYALIIKNGTNQSA